VVVFAECIGSMRGKRLRREVYTSKFIGANGLTAIQSTTAGGGLAVLELILKGELSGIVTHSSVPLSSFTNTQVYKHTYFSKT